MTSGSVIRKDAMYPPLLPEEPPRAAMTIHAIFYAQFLPQKGTKVLHQSPPGCIVSETGVDKTRLFDFETLAEYIVPRQVFCNQELSICDPDNKYRILGFPICIKDLKYERNEFMFNFCLVISTDTDIIPYRKVVRRLAATFKEMEIQTQFLSQHETSTSGDRRSISSLLEIIKEDLNNYNECMIPVDDANTINMKLFPHHPEPPPVKSWHVPVAKLKFSEVMDDTWDLTMKKVIEHIDGIKDIRRIAHDADVDLNLAKIAIQHLLYYDTILMLDLFLFSNIYAPTPQINDFIQDKDNMQDECSNYVYIASTSTPKLSNFYLCRLYTSLATSRTLKEWIKMHLEQDFNILAHVDVRRFIQFGVIKGLIYRINKFAVSSQYLASLLTGQSVNIEGGDVLQKYTDGVHCFDQITAETNMGDPKIMDALRKFPKGDVEIIYR